MFVYVGITILSLIGALTIFYYSLVLEEFIMKKIIGKGLIESTYDLLVDLVRDIRNILKFSW